MSTELEKQGIFPVDPPMSEIGQMIQTAIQTPEFNPDGLKMLLEQKRIEEDRGAERAFLKAKALFQRDCPAIKHDCQGKAGSGIAWTYASLGLIEFMVKPVCAKHGLSYDWQERDGRLYCVLAHRYGHSRECSFTLSTDGQQGGLSKMTRQQQEGATDTYARGRTLTAVLGIGTAQQDLGGATPKDKPEDKPDKLAIQIKKDWLAHRHELDGKTRGEQGRQFAAWFIAHTDAKVFTPAMNRWTESQLNQCRSQLDKEASARGVTS